MRSILASTRGATRHQRQSAIAWYDRITSATPDPVCIINGWTRAHSLPIVSGHSADRAACVTRSAHFMAVSPDALPSIMGGLSRDAGAITAQLGRDDDQLAGTGTPSNTDDQPDGTSESHINHD